MPFDPSVLRPNPELRATILQILEAGLKAVDPAAATRRFLQREGHRLTVAGRTYDLDRYRHIYVIGAGKAGAPMAQAVEAVLGDRLTGGLVVVKTGHAGPTHTVELVEASHPRPDEAGVEAGRRILELAQSAGEEDLVIALLSGGGSALLVAPAEGLTLADIQAMTDALLACGATINEINCLRKHCSAVKGGQLARAVYPATLVTLALSDVVGSPLDVIASGPTVPDSSTWADAWAIVERYELAQKLPRPILARLEAGLAGQIPDTPKPGDAVFERCQTVVVADNRTAALAARAQAQALGFHTLLLSTFVEGEAAQVARVVAALGKEIRASGEPVQPPACLILGGETTVTLGPEPGQGGRNQELALAAAVALAGTQGITVVSLATDGTDGPTDSAGGLADGATVARGRAAGLDAEAHLRRHDAYPFLAATDDLLRSGPTQTNVNDLIFVFVTG
ncbi:glycerate kinase [Litorilinea aerophila]|uniref:Glycerate kinase n=1 Tax=Litorilinea aerophila TaxID=1204385 RepID=A0A540VEU8_9CHLR|nr:glycerate kinase [Litorilinea aerophila]MCC9077037.1 glycerate kinase [Litorilinea aerophila]GIV76755.1 MAG: hydroxypyruvate reductase [Litorilinea sp.]